MDDQFHSPVSPGSVSQKGQRSLCPFCYQDQYSSGGLSNRGSQLIAGVMKSPASIICDAAKAYFLPLISSKGTITSVLNPLKSRKSFSRAKITTSSYGLATFADGYSDYIFCSLILIWAIFFLSGISLLPLRPPEEVKISLDV